VDAVSEGDADEEEEDAATGGNGRPAAAPAGEEDGPPRQTRPAPIARGGGVKIRLGFRPERRRFGTDRTDRGGARRITTRRRGDSGRGGDRFGGKGGGNDGDDETEGAEEEEGGGGCGVWFCLVRVGFGTLGGLVGNKSCSGGVGLGGWLGAVALRDLTRPASRPGTRRDSCWRRRADLAANKLSVKNILGKPLLPTHIRFL
jgi:hypothetical protein